MYFAETEGDEKMKKVILVVCIIAITATITAGCFYFITNNNSKETNTSVSENKNTTSEGKQIENKQPKENTSKSENKTSTNTTKKEETKKEEFAEDSFKGIWHYPNNTYPEEELVIKKIDGNKITFDYAIDGITTFEDATATLDKNTATFDVKNEGDWNIKGTMIFEGKSIKFNIEKSSNENIPETSITFTVKSDKRAF